MWEVFASGKEPYPGMTMIEVQKRVGTEKYRMRAPSRTPPLIEKLMQSCWEQKAESRPPFENLRIELEAIHRKTN